MSDPSLAVRLFRQVLRTWPAEVRAEFGEGMLTTFRERIGAARRRGHLALGGVTVRELIGALTVGLKLRFTGADSSRRGRRGEERSPGAGLEGFAHDLRHAVRRLWRRPALSVAIVATLALGLGLNLGLFTLVESILLSPLPFPDPERLVGLWSTRDGAPTRFGNLSWQDLDDYSRGLESFSSLAGYTTPGEVAVSGVDRPIRLAASRVTPTLFETLGVAPVAGRFFSEAESSADVVVVSEDYARRAFGDLDPVGRALRVEGRNLRVVGVASLPAGSLSVARADLWLPLGEITEHSRGSRNLVGVGRLAEGRRIEGASEEMDALAAALASAYPDSNEGMSALPRPLHELVVGGSTPRLLLLMQGAGLLVLLVAVTNVAGLLVASARARSAETAVMRALGASATRVRRVVFFEAALLASFAAGVAVLAASRLPGLLIWLLPADLPRIEQLSIDWPAVATATAVATVAIALASALPGWRQATRASLVATIGASRAVTDGPGEGRLRATLVVVQIALATALVFSAGLLLRSFDALTSVHPGFDPEGVATVRVDLPSERYPDPASVLGFHEAARARLSALPGVDAVSAGSVVPLSGENLCDAIRLPGRDEAEEDCVEFRVVFPGYFDVLRTTLVAGRSFDSADRMGEPNVVIVNRSLAERIREGDRAVGVRFEGRGAEREIVGVVEDMHDFALDREPVPTAYLPFAQAPLRWVNYLVRTRAGGAGVEAEAIREALQQVDPELALPAVDSLSRLVSDSVATPRARSMLVTVFGAVSLLLATVGIAAVAHHSVARRRREIGIRIAVGNDPGGAARLIVGDTLRLTGAGLLLGCVLGAVCARLLQASLFGVTTTDPVALLATLGLLGGAALLGSAWPARRALAVDPAEALRAE